MAQGTVHGSKAAITSVVMAAGLMATIDISIVNVALSDIRASFGTPIDQIGWASTGYMMANIVIIPMSGWLQRRFGFARYFAASILLFTIASALCGLAWNLPALVVFRVLQGLGGGAIIPTSQAILFARYPREQHGMAAAMFGLGAMTGPLFGPTLGGYLIQVASWHWVFLINVPIGIVLAIAVPKVIHEEGFTPDRARIDATGIALLAVGMASLQYVLEEGNRHGWGENLIVGLAALAAVALVTFIVHELEAENPVVDLRVFKNRSYAAGTGLNFLVGLALFGTSYLFSLYCGSVMHYTALDIGHIFLIAGSLQVLTMPIVGKLSGRAPARVLLLWGVTVVIVSQYFAAQLTHQASFYDLLLPNLIRALGLGFIFIPLSVASLSDLPMQQRGNAAGLFNLTRELGGSLGTAWMGKVIADGIVLHNAQLGERVSLLNPLLQQHTAELARRGIDPAAMMSGRVATQSLVMSFQDGFRLTTLAIALGLLMVLLMRKPHPAAELPAGVH